MLSIGVRIAIPIFDYAQGPRRPDTGLTGITVPVASGGDVELAVLVIIGNGNAFVCVNGQ